MKILAGTCNNHLLGWCACIHILLVFGWENVHELCFRRYKWTSLFISVKLINQWIFLKVNKSRKVPTTGCFFVWDYKDKKVEKIIKCEWKERLCNIHSQLKPRSSFLLLYDYFIKTTSSRGFHIYTYILY